MPLTAGTRLRPYEIINALGAGGMGEVYRASDTMLNRDVALKILPEQFASQPERVARFEREAQLLASLNHPHIAQIYAVENIDGVRALAMELVPGRTLGESIDGAPGLRLHESLAIARQIAVALEAAHEKGIIHRDLKPGNVMITPDGEVKLLDFGFGKALDPSDGPAEAGRHDAANSPTMTGAATQMGVLLGTAAYMAPEQARGHVVNKRCDIWAFGCVFFEMLAGRRAFQGEGVSDTLAAILRGEPDWGALAADTPAHIRRLLTRCLEKDRPRRLRDIGDVLFELDDEGAATSSAAAAPVASRRSERAWMAAAIVFALSTVAVTTWKYFEPKVPLESVQFAVAAPDKTTVGNRGPGFLALSPDGRRLVMAATGDGKSQLWVRGLDSLTPQVLPGTDGGWQPAWSPDSQSIAFQVGDTLKRADLKGGAPLTLAECSAGTAAWSREGVILVTGRDSRLYRVPESGGQPVAVTELDESRQETSHGYPIFLPDGRRFIFLAHSRDASKSALFLSSIDSPSRTHLVDVLSQVAYAQGYLFYQRDGTLMAQPFDEKAGRLAGDASPVIEGIDYNAANGRAVFSVSTTGTLAYRANNRDGIEGATLTWFDRQGKPLGSVGEPGGYPQGTMRVSPDGRRLDVSRGDNRLAQNDIWTVDLARAVMTRLTSDPAHDLFPVWSASGTHVIFASARKGVSDLYQRAADGSGADELLFASPQSKTPTDVSSDGKLLLFTRNVDGKKADVGVAADGRRHAVSGRIDGVRRRERRLLAGPTLDCVQLQ